jgi:Flp pilus assembly pilin Flp
MTRLFRQLWDDDDGAILSVELILILAVIVFGIIPGVVALRNSLIAALATTGNVLQSITPNFTYSGYAITDGTTSGQPIALIGGIGVSPNTVLYLSGVQVAPATATYVVVAPAP